MKQLKRIITVAFIIATTISCTKEEVSVEPIEKTTEKSVLSFQSEKEMNDKIAEIDAFKNAQEQEIIQKILTRNNLSAPKLEDITNTTKRELTETDKAKALEDVKFYHQEKIKAIYEERAHFGFTSIQSIADEINFLKLINPTKANNLLKENVQLLEVNKNFVGTNSKTCLVTNTQGTYILDNKVIKLEPNHKKSQKALIAGTEGVLATNYFYAITYHTGVEGSNVFTQFGSFLLGNLYPSWFTATPNSKTWYYDGLLSYLSYPTGANNIVRNTIGTRGGTNITEGLAAGSFATIVNGQWVYASGSVPYKLY